MFTDTQIEQLRNVIREEVEAEGKRTHTDVTFLSVEVKGAIVRLENRMKDLEISNGRFEKGQKEQGTALARIEKKLSKEITGNAEALDEISIKLNQLTDHEARIAQLEEDNKFLPH